MVVSTSEVARRYEDVSAGTPISVDIPAYEASDVYVYYGNASLLAERGTDYTVALAGDFETFTVTPTAALIAKMQTLAAADVTEENYITVRRRLDYLTDATPDGVRYTPFTSRELDRNAMRDQQLAEDTNRSVKLPENRTGAAPYFNASTPDAVLKLSADGSEVVDGPTTTAIADAEDNAAIASAAAAAAKIAEANALDSENATRQLLEGFGQDSPKPSRMAYIEQFVTGLHGRGMLASETDNLITQGTITNGAAAGATVLTVSDNSVFTVGGMCTVLHDNGLYDSYTVYQVGAGTLAIAPSLRYAVSAGAAIERLWYNRAHPGKFYMRYLAQRVARAIEHDAAFPNGTRTVFSFFDSNPNTIEDSLTALGSATINYYDASSASAGAGHAPRFIFGRSAFVGTTNVGDGAETPYFKVQSSAPLVAKVAFVSMSNAPDYRLSVVDQDGNELAGLDLPASIDNRAPRILTLPFRPGLATLVKVKLTATANPTTSFVLDMIDVFEAPETSGHIVGGPSPKIVCLGDSWIAGDLASTAEREPITQQLALELAHATVVNAGIGGQKVWEMLARFDTDVAPHNPQYVVVNTGTNESYSPASSVFDPNAIDFWIDSYNQLIERIKEIGARPIIIGVPALAEDDPIVTEDPSADVDPNVSPYPFDDWAINERARKYMLAFQRRAAPQPLANGGRTGPESLRVGLTLTSGATPNVANVRRVDLEYASATTITNFVGGAEGQVLTLVALNGNTAIQNNASIVLGGGASVVLATNDTVTLMRVGSVWVEISRSVGAEQSEITLTAGTTPDVANAKLVNLNYASATTITNFTGGVKNQEIQIRAENGNVTLQSGPYDYFRLNGLVNLTLTADSVITLRRLDPALTARWVEVSRSIK